MSLTSQVIRSRLTDANPQDIDLLSGLIEDALPAGAGLVEIERAISKAREAYPPLFVRPAAPAAAAAPAGETVTQKAVREASERRARAEANKDASTADLNPWAPATRNLTQQVLLERRDPAKAARLKAAAAR